jgi:hypothetical protein
MRTKPKVLERFAVNPNKPAIYFLYYQNEIVYIGQSRKPEERIIHHKYRFKFDSYALLDCDEEDLSSVESELIFKYAPKFNRTISTKINGIYPVGYVIENTTEKTEFSITAKIIGRTLYLNLTELGLIIHKRLDGGGAL